MDDRTTPENAIYAITFYDHHSWQALSTGNARDFSDATLITVFGRIIKETKISIMVENTHVDRSQPELAGENSVVVTGWNIIKGAIVTKILLGIWEHPSNKMTQWEHSSDDKETGA